VTREAAFHASRIFDGSRWHEDAALLVREGRVAAILPRAVAPAGERVAGWIVPGLIDLQVNGGGGVLFNNAPDSASIETICAAHARFGTTASMVTLITDTPEVTQAAIAAAEAAEAAGFLGLHLEGPHLSLARKGTHDPSLIRRMEADDLALILQAAQALANLIVTLAPESVTPEQVQALAAAGVTVSLGHSDCTATTARAYADAGARMATHLFNAMSQITPREAGLVGAVLEDARLSAGLIADGFHVAEEVLRLALRVKPGLFLVSDAMSTIGSDQTSFTLNGRQIFRAEGRLTLADGTLAGADIALIDAVRHLHLELGQPLEQVLPLAALAPAKAMGLTDRGHLQPGARADFFSLTQQIGCAASWILGERVA
jgi:N-acetylglucosamine-6-phosphate deacetylase